MIKTLENQDLAEQTAIPIVDRVRHVIIGEDFAGVRLDRFLHKHYPEVPRIRLFRIVRKGEVRVNRKRADIDTRLALGDDVRLPPVKDLPPTQALAQTERLATALKAKDYPGGTLEVRCARGKSLDEDSRGLDSVAPAFVAPVQRAMRVPQSLIETVTKAIIHEDDRLLVIDKPAGLAVHGGSGVSLGLIEALRAARPNEKGGLELVHRLDRDTSGVLLVSRRPAVLRMLHANLRDGDGFEKRYLTLVKGCWNLGKKRIDAPLRTDLRMGGERTVKVQPGGKPSVSDFRPVQFFGRTATLLEVSILTGRTHQIRVHSAFAGHPVAGDSKYGDKEFNAEMRDLGLNRMFLHASSLSLVWPDKGTEFSVNAPLPPALAEVIDNLTIMKKKKPARPSRWR